VPRAVLLSLVLVGLVYVFCIWAEVNGLGPEAANRVGPTSAPWNDLAARYADWMKWPVIVASVSSMFAVMVNSANGIARILTAMAREGMLPATLAQVDKERHAPARAIVATGTFAIVSACLVGAVSGGLDNPNGGANVYGYLGFLLTLGILPVYVLTNLAATRWFLATRRFRLVRHGLVPLGGAALMIALLVGQIVEQTGAPYTWLPWVIVGWVALLALAVAWLSLARPHRLALAGLAFGGP
jgi:amino acid transporter